MPIPYYDLTKKQINIVNSDNEDYKKKGLKPLFVDKIPLFILPNNELFSYTTSHYGTNLHNDIRNIKSTIESPEKFPYLELIKEDNHYLLEEFDYLFKLDIAKNLHPEIKDLDIKPIKDLYNYFLTYEDNKVTGNTYQKQDKLKIILSELERVKLLLINAQSELKNKTAYDLTGNDVRNFINRVPNVFPFGTYNKYFDYYETKGLFTEEMFSIAKSITTSKEYVYNYFINIIEKSNNKETLNTIKELIENNYNLSNKEEPCDILVQNINFSKIETVVPKTITTSRQNINEDFFNYLIMDYNIVEIPKKIYQDNQFIEITKPKYYETETEREYQEEIKLIKKHIPIQERPNYFK